MAVPIFRTYTSKYQRVDPFILEYQRKLYSLSVAAHSSDMDNESNSNDDYNDKGAKIENLNQKNLNSSSSFFSSSPADTSSSSSSSSSYTSLTLTTKSFSMTASNSTTSDNLSNNVEKKSPILKTALDEFDQVVQRSTTTITTTTTFENTVSDKSSNSNNIKGDNSLLKPPSKTQTTNRSGVKRKLSDRYEMDSFGSENLSTDKKDDNNDRVNSTTKEETNGPNSLLTTKKQSTTFETYGFSLKKTQSSSSSSSSDSDNSFSLSDDGDDSNGDDNNNNNNNNNNNLKNKELSNDLPWSVSPKKSTSKLLLYSTKQSKSYNKSTSSYNNYAHINKKQRLDNEAPSIDSSQSTESLNSTTLKPKTYSSTSKVLKSSQPEQTQPSEEALKAIKELNNLFASVDETELDESILPTKSRTILMSLEEQKARAGIESFIEKEKIQKEYNRYKEAMQDLDMNPMSLQDFIELNAGSLVFEKRGD